MSNSTLEPPRFATALLKACCSPDRLEEIEGDVCELYARRAAREGLTRARRRYVIDVCSVCVRQLGGRGRRALRRTVIGAVELHPLRVLACLAVVSACLMSSDYAWAVIASQLLLAVFTLLELLIYARVVYSIFRRRRGGRRLKS